MDIQKKTDDIASPLNFFEKLRNSLSAIDPVAFCEKHLTLDGRPFRLNGTGYKPFSDIYRYIGVKSLEKDAKPVILVKGRQVGASTMSVALELYFMACGLFGINGKPPMRIVHCFPQLDISKRHAKTKLNPMITGSLQVPDPKHPHKTVPVITTKIDPTSDTSDSLTYKQFIGGGFIATESAGLTGDRLRGYTADAIFFDEVQDIHPAAIANTDQILRQAQYGNKGVKVYFGTPKKEGSAYHKMWKKSTQNYYYLGCEACKEYFPLYTPKSNDWEDIWIEDSLPKNHPQHGYIVRCPFCGAEQDKREAAERGKWVAMQPEESSDLIGYHINQLYMPNMTRDDILKQKPEFHYSNTERVYQNEILGEFYSGDTAPLTPEELEAAAADYNRKFVYKIFPTEQKRVYLGADWGQKIDIEQSSEEDEEKYKNVGKSYSCVVILTVEGPNILSIQYANMLPKKDLNFKIQFIEQMYREFNVSLGVGDIGDAGDLTEILQKKFGPRFMASRAMGTLLSKAKFVNDHCPHSGEIQFDRNYHISELINFIKHKRMRFPFGDFEKIAWLINHCCSMDLKPKIDKFGDIKTQYVKGNTPNDGFMALLNAYLAYKYDLTQGFKIKDPNRYENNNLQESKDNKIPAILGFFPTQTHLFKR